MQQRLGLCRVLLHGPELLLLDEPYSGLDASARTLVDDVLAEAAGAKTLVVASHEPEHVRPLATQALALA
jgi:ABC-type multidrug transport system ATPase subunit